MRVASAVAVASFLLAPAATAAAQDLGASRTQTIDVTVEETETFTISTSSPAPISVAADGQPHTFSGGTYNVSTNVEFIDERKIQVSVLSSLIPGVAIEVSLAYDGAHGNSAGYVVIATTNHAYDAVFGIYSSFANAQAITYRLTVPVTTAAFHTTRVVAFTLISSN